VHVANDDQHPRLALASERRRLQLERRWRGEVSNVLGFRNTHGSDSNGDDSDIGARHTFCTWSTSMIVEYSGHSGRVGAGTGSSRMRFCTTHVPRRHGGKRHGGRYQRRTIARRRAFNDFSSGVIPSSATAHDTQRLWSHEQRTAHHSTTRAHN
jgi:hypothetical protein